jgi:hypothetical protein
MVAIIPTDLLRKQEADRARRLMPLRVDAELITMGEPTVTCRPRLEMLITVSLTMMIRPGPRSSFTVTIAAGWLRHATSKTTSQPVATWSVADASARPDCRTTSTHRHAVRALQDRLGTERSAAPRCRQGRHRGTDDMNNHPELFTSFSPVTTPGRMSGDGGESRVVEGWGLQRYGRTVERGWENATNVWCPPMAARAGLSGGPTRDLSFGLIHKSPRQRVNVGGL